MGTVGRSEVDLNERVVWLDHREPRTRPRGRTEEGQDTNVCCFWQVPPRLLPSMSRRGGRENEQNLGHGWVVVEGRRWGMGSLSSPNISTLDGTARSHNSGSESLDSGY